MKEDWLKMSPEYRIHTAVGCNGYEGIVPWEKTRKEILAEKMDAVMKKMKADSARYRLKKMEYKLKQERLKREINLYGSKGD